MNNFPKGTQFIKAKLGLEPSSDLLPPKSSMNQGEGS